jgi:hypothetical protein
VFNKRDDVWRFMRSIGQAVEGRVWHEEDKKHVKLLLAVMKEATGGCFVCRVLVSSRPACVGLFRRSAYEVGWRLIFVTLFDFYSNIVPPRLAEGVA